MKLSVLVPTYRRTQDLRRCLAALQAQARPPDEVIVTVRADDDETRTFLDGFNAGALPLRAAGVAGPGVVAAMNAGLAAAQGDIVALTDDDAAPYPDWLARIEAHFQADDALGGVGGRDRVIHADGHVEEGAEAVVGRVQWHGRVIGGHHLGVGGPREADLLKGVNGAYRVGPLRRLGFDTRLWGAGAQVHWELSLGLALKRDGWKLLYDPAVGVDHYRATRHDEDKRDRFSGLAHRNAVYNETLILWEHLSPLRRAAFLAWLALVGTKVAPGLLLAAYLAARRTPDAAGRAWATAQGRAHGVLAGLRAGHRPGP